MVVISALAIVIGSVSCSTTTCKAKAGVAGTASGTKDAVTETSAAPAAVPGTAPAEAVPAEQPSAVVETVKTESETAQAVAPAETTIQAEESMPAKTQETAVNPVVVIETSMGTIRAELWSDKSPETVKNFVEYVKAGFYNGLIFHRVINHFMIQGGGFDAALQQKPTRAPVRNEARSDVKNARGTLAMARTSDINSATAQFFINLVDNSFLDHRDNSAQGFGYCVFGKVTEGLDVVDGIANAQTTTKRGMGDVPVQTITIKSIALESK